MKQIIQDIKSGETLIENIPTPKIKNGHVLIKSHNSLVSLGTEKMLVDFGKASYIQKAKQQPEKVKQVLNKIKTDGLIPTLETVFRKLGEPLPLGYCNAGEVIGVCSDIKNFKIGDRVASNGNHAEYVNVHENLVSHIPNNVTYEEASFTVIGSIGLQGIRLLNPSFGETVVVYGLGLIGILSSKLLLANGCNVIGLDNDNSKVEFANKIGIKSFNSSNNSIVDTVKSHTQDSIGVDGILITASSKSNNIISLSCQMCRKRGKIVLVGVVGLSLNRSEMYEKELTFQVSCSYGPGRYDFNYENKGIDYPLPYVRWTENRNFTAILNAISTNKIDVKPLITSINKLDDFKNIYDNLNSNSNIASLISYNIKEKDLTRNLKLKEKIFNNSNDIIGIIGAGNFTSNMIIPILNKMSANIKYIASSNGLSGTRIAKKYNIPNSTTDLEFIFKDNEVKSVIISTRHNIHYNQVIESFKNGKNVFVEKPLALKLSELDSIIDSYKKNNLSLTVGFNRRFSPFTIKAKNAIGNNSSPINIIATINAGFIPKNSWVQDLEIGGGRIIGEACHFIDLISFLTGSSVKAVVMNSNGINPKMNTDNVSILLKYENGSMGIINYFSNGNKKLSKEKIEIFDQGRNIIIDNFRKIKFFGYNLNSWSSNQDKGHSNMFKLWYDMIKNGGESIIPIKSLYNTSKASILSIDSLKQNKWIDVS